MHKRRRKNARVSCAMTCVCERVLRVGCCQCVGIFLIRYEERVDCRAVEVALGCNERTEAFRCKGHHVSTGSVREGMAAAGEAKKRPHTKIWSTCSVA